VFPVAVIRNPNEFLVKCVLIRIRDINLLVELSKDLLATWCFVSILDPDENDKNYQFKEVLRREIQGLKV
jgi:hypothetical protein